MEKLTSTSRAITRTQGTITFAVICLAALSTASPAQAQKTIIKNHEDWKAAVAKEQAIVDKYKEASDRCEEEAYRDDRPSDLQRIAAWREETEKAKAQAFEQAQKEDRYFTRVEDERYRGSNWVCRAVRPDEYLLAKDNLSYLKTDQRFWGVRNPPRNPVRKPAKKPWKLF